MKKTLSTVVLLLFVASGFTGCHTLRGVKQDVQEVPQEVGNGAAAVGHGVMRADTWVRDNMW
jgi:predicted small secreted protein